MVDPKHGRLSIARQCRLVSIARSSFYYEGRGESPVNLQPAAAHRRAVLGVAVLRLTADDALAVPPWLHGEAASGCAG